MNASENEILIEAEHVSKKFCRSLKRSLWYGVKDIATALNPWSTAEDHSLPTDQNLREDEFWAIKDVSFQVRRGECLGLIGHNGAGKSTLLKMLNGLNHPDRGKITMRGRIGALIELGAGFNPILTGRENIYNQAALLGFSKQETDAKFDAIVDFSELEQFLDMPVQNYSSGMKVKLGFAVSSQMEPDILLIDEVLAVGDVGFRFKCLNRMAELQKTCAVIFVSHSMTQVMRVATEVLVLSKGSSLVSSRDIGEGLAAYFNLFNTQQATTTGSGELSITDASATAGGKCCTLHGELRCDFNDTVSLSLDVGSTFHISDAVVQILFWNQELIPVLDVFGGDKHGYHFPINGERTRIRFEIPQIPLNAGRYSVSLILTAPNLERVYCQMDHALNLIVCSGNQTSGAGCLINGKWDHETV